MKHIVPFKSLLTPWISLVACVCVFSLDHFIAWNILTSLQRIYKLFPCSLIVFQKQQNQHFLTNKKSIHPVATCLLYAFVSACLIKLLITKKYCSNAPLCFSAIILSISCSPRPKLGKLLSPMFLFGLVTNTVQTRSNWHVNIIAVQAM